MADVLITVLMSVHNEEKNIDEAIQSILAQTYDNFEFIIIDDNSTDRTVERILNYDDKRIIFLQNSVNKGLTKNLNYGIKLAKGKYILRMDGDDISLQNRFEKQIEFMEEHPEIALSGCWIKEFGKSNNVLKTVTDIDLIKLGLIFNNVMVHSTFIIRKEFLDRYRIKYDEKLRYAQDYMFVYQISQKGLITNLPIVLLKYRIHSNQISTKKSELQLECADMTRKVVLRDLGIKLNIASFQLWSDFCNRIRRKLSFRDVITLLNIVKLIISQNQKRAVYHEFKLKEQLYSRLKEYCESNIKIIGLIHFK